MRRRMKPVRKRKKRSRPKGLKPGMRMKGGVRFDPEAGGFFVIVHTWDNVACRGEPEEWRYPEPFPTEDAAMHYYKVNIRPVLKQMMAEAASQDSGLAFRYRELEE